MHRISNTLETGISRRLWDHYRRVEQTSGIPVYLIFVHEQEAEVRAASLKFLAPLARFYAGDRMGSAGLVFFPYKSIPPAASWQRLQR